MQNNASAFAPATVANLSCGFDLLGMAIAQPGDEVEVAFNDTGKVRMVEITGDDGKLSLNAPQNTAGMAVISLHKQLDEKRGIDIRLHKKMPFGSGLGSSAASAVAAVVAANKLLGNPFCKKELLPFALDGEAVASGAKHADNVAPSLLGGIVLIRGYAPLDLVQLPVPDNLYCAVIYPKVEILTKQARNILPEKVSMKDAITQSGNLAGFVAGLYTNDLKLVNRSITDVLAEPYRSPLIPEFEKVKQAARYGGALAFGISGSGPSMFALVEGGAKAMQISELMQKALHRKGIENTVFCSKVNAKGAYCL